MSRGSIRRSGLTLIELVMVIAILAILAGLVVPLVDYLRRSSEKASAATGIAEVVNNVQLFRTTFGKYPDQYDSMLDDGGTPALYSKLDGKFQPSDGNKLMVTTIATQLELDSLRNVGIRNVFDHSAAVDPPNRGDVGRVLAIGGSLAAINTGSSTGRKIIDSIYPPPVGGASGSGLPANVKLILLGIGPRCTAIGKTLQAAPVHAAVDPNTVYPRFSIIVAMYSDGKRAAVRAGLDSKGDFLAQDVEGFYENQPE